MRQTRKRKQPFAPHRNIYLGNHRTSFRLEPAMWDALMEIAKERGQSFHDVVVEIDRRRDQSNLSSAIRVYIVEHYRTALQKARNGD